MRQNVASSIRAARTSRSPMEPPAHDFSLPEAIAWQG
jgi:hypothetical protein